MKNFIIWQLSLFFFLVAVPCFASEVGNWPLDEGSGATAADVSGFGNDGSIIGSPAWSSGVSGSALSFAGDGGRVVVPDNGSLDIQNSITIAAWMRPSKKGTQYVVKKARYGVNDGYELSLSSTGKAFVRFNQVSLGNTFKLFSVSTYPTNGVTWVHVTATYDGDEIKLYMDGILESSILATGLVIGANNNELSIGAQDDGLRPFVGDIDEVHLLDVALTEAEVLALTNLTSATDSDGDGMPDDWEVFFGLNPLDPTDARIDSDKDGVINLDEFLQGRNPRSVSVIPTGETDPVSTPNDSADDPAIWINPQDPSASHVFGTNKKRGVAVYDLLGNEIQFLPDGRINNVDVRYGVSLNGSSIDILAGSNRTDDSISVYQIDSTTGLLQNISAGGTIPIGITPAYGFCLYRSPITGKLYGNITSKTGDFEQYELFDNGSGFVDGTLVRAFTIGNISEGCVVDDENGSLYISEEDVGIWKYGAEPSDGQVRTLVDVTGFNGHLTSDVEGLTIYYASNGTGYLIASSQGNSSYVLYRREGNNSYVGTFRIKAGNGIEGTSFTDGIDVTNVFLGSGYPNGLFVAHDDRSNDTQNNSNFKIVPWDSIANAFYPPLIIETTVNSPLQSIGILSLDEGSGQSLDEGSGLTSFDMSGNGNDGTLNGGANGGTTTSQGDQFLPPEFDNIVVNQELIPEDFSAFNITEARVKCSNHPNDDKFTIEGEVVLGDSNNGIDPIIENVTVKVGTSSLVIPSPFSFVEEMAGRFKFNGTVNGADVEMKIEEIDFNTFDFEIKVKGTDLTDTSNPVDVGLTIGDDTGIATVKLTGELMFGNKK